ncbi:MAG TPA: hypothetical protein ENN21_01160 [Spirochaetes bacterium]|nr:hypothetical protein [Spirochaetota bacterium]
MRAGRTVIIIMTFALVAVLCGCETTFTLRQPDGFAVYTRETASYKAITADGVRLRAFSRKNEPRGDAGMWGETVRVSLAERGYRLTSEKALSGRNNMRGKLYEYDYWYNGEDYRYSVGLFVEDDVVYIIEACGEAASYDRRKNDIAAAMNSFDAKKN